MYFLRYNFRDGANASLSTRNIFFCGVKHLWWSLKFMRKVVLSQRCQRARFAHFAFVGIIEYFLFMRAPESTFTNRLSVARGTNRAKVSFFVFLSAPNVLCRLNIWNRTRRIVCVAATASDCTLVPGGHTLDVYTLITFAPTKKCCHVSPSAVQRVTRYQLQNKKILNMALGKKIHGDTRTHFLGAAE